MKNYNMEEHFRPKVDETIPGMNTNILEKHPELSKSFVNAQGVLDKANVTTGLSMETLKDMHAIKKILALFPNYKEHAGLN